MRISDWSSDVCASDRLFTAGRVYRSEHEGAGASHRSRNNGRRGIMNTISTSSNADWRARFRTFFTTRDFILHDGRDLRRFSVGGKTQAALASVLAVTLGFSAYGVAQAGMSAVTDRKSTLLNCSH